MTTFKDYREILLSEMSRRMKSNPRYSQRAFARALGLNPSRLNEILSGKDGLSRSSALSVAERLRMGEGEKEVFVDLVELRHGRSRAARELAKRRLESRSAMLVPSGTAHADTLQSLADWHHFAILSLCKGEGLDGGAEAISSRLGIPLTDTESAIERLARIGLLEGSDGRLKAREGAVVGTDGLPLEAVRRFHEQILEEARWALRFQEPRRTDYGSVVLTIGADRIEEAKALIQEFRRSLAARFESASAQRDQLYCLTMQFFELSGTPDAKPS